MNEYEKYMNAALKLALKGQGLTSPNPLVGAIVVNNNKIVGRGYHKKAGDPHAEILALNEAKYLAVGGQLYVNLEPCCHHNRTGPCTETIIKSGISQVAVGMIDPNPKVAGKGILALKKAGIEVAVGILKEKCCKANEFFAKHIIDQKPFVILKIAESLDGKIATFTGESKWITNEKSRQYVHALRHQVDAVLVGVDTVISDNPYLTVRNLDKILRQPKRIVVDSSLRIPLTSNILHPKSAPDVIIGTTSKAPSEKIKEITDKGVNIIVTDAVDGRVSMKSFLSDLGQLGIMSVLVEGGSKVNTSFVEAGLIDRVIVFISASIIGGDNAYTAVGGVGFDTVSKALKLTNIKFKRIEDNIMVEGDVVSDLNRPSAIHTS